MKINPISSIQVFQKRITPIVSKRLFRIIFFLPPLLSIGTTVLILFFFSQLPPQIPLYYSRPWGEDQLTQPLYLFLLPMGSLVWYIITAILITVETYQYRVFAQLLFIFSALVSLFSTYTVIMILILVL